MTHDMTHDFSRTPPVFKAEKAPQIGAENDPFSPLLRHGLTQGFLFAMRPDSCTNVTQPVSRFVNRTAHFSIDKKDSGRLEQRAIGTGFIPSHKFKANFLDGDFPPRIIFAVNTSMPPSPLRYWGLAKEISYTF
jgi:hypothetical protein